MVLKILFKLELHNSVWTGCTGGVGRGHMISNGISSGGGHGGKGGAGCYNGRCADGSYIIWKCGIVDE